MAIATLLGLRARMTPPAASRPGDGRRAPKPAEAGVGGAALRGPEVDRVLRLATGLFGVGTVALVLAGPDGLTVAAASEAARATEPEAREVDVRAPEAGASRDAAVAAACRLFEVLAAAEPPETGPSTGVMEEITLATGFVAATPILSAAGRCLGAVVLLDGLRRTLLTGMQRRLFGEFGSLLLPALGAPPSASSADTDAEAAARLQALADAEPDAFALFDADGRCLLRNARFDALIGASDPSPETGEGDRPSTATCVHLAEARGCEASWIALRLARDVAPVGVYRAALADGTWLSVEERRGPHGRSLLARVEGSDAFGGDGELAQLFERCPCPMFVFDRDTRAVLAVNAAALTLYGWDRDAFLRLGVDGIGPVDPAAASAGWTHRTRDGRPLPVSGRTVDLAHRGRPAVLVTVDSASAAAERAA